MITCVVFDNTHMCTKCMCTRKHSGITTVYEFAKLSGEEPVRVAGTKRKRESTPLLDELEDYEEEEEEIEERKTESPPPRVAAAAPVKREEEGEKREREEERERVRERQREREGERRREREEGGSPTKVMKMADREGEESRSRSQRSSAIAKKIIKVLQVWRLYTFFTVDNLC